MSITAEMIFIWSIAVPTVALGFWMNPAWQAVGDHQWQSHKQQKTLSRMLKVIGSIGLGVSFVPL